MPDLEKYFNSFRRNIVGINSEIETPCGKKKLVYADWIASGRLYKPIEDKLLNRIVPLVGNTHSESSSTGIAMTSAYREVHEIIKNHVNVDVSLSKEITERIEAGDLSLKPGWIRLSLHPTMTNDELLFIVDAIKETVRNASEWGRDYRYDNHTNEFYHRSFPEQDFSHWFKIDTV